MRKLAKSLLAVIAVALPGSAFAADYVIDPSHTSVGFTVRHLMVTKVRGSFEKVSGTVKYDPNEPEKIVIDATIDAASINTREAKRDEHLRSPDFFDVAKHPTLTFKSKKAKVLGKGKLEVIGDLTIRGVTKEVTLQVEGLDQEIKDPWGNVRRGATATTRINRKDFGLAWNQVLETGGVVVGEDVDIQIDVELIRQAAKEEAAAK
ncbi:MAG: YceI family protein [Pseudomonadota bacterium]|nr:MAG: protein yceI precursor [Pseudomonadota bacterium]